MRSHKRWIGWIVGIILAMCVVSTGVLFWKQPLLGKSLKQFNTQIAQTQQNQPVPTAISEISSDPTVIPVFKTPVSTVVTDLPVQKAISHPSNNPKPVCGGPDQIMILALGIDENGQSDVIRLVKLDFINKKVIVLSIPRDLYLPLPGFEDYNITIGRINSAFGFGEVYLGRGQGVFATANAFAYNFGLTFDQYIVGHFSSLVKLVDRVGGVEVTLDKSAIGYGDVFFSAGTHQLDGEQALSLARVRKGDSDIHRIERQTLILKAILNKVKDSMSVLELTAFGIDTINDKGIQTDLSVGDMVTLACFGKLLTAEDISFVNPPPELYFHATSNAGAWIFLPNEGLFPFVQDLFGVVK